jgi:hypothetical protein
LALRLALGAMHEVALAYDADELILLVYDRYRADMALEEKLGDFLNRSR